MKGVAGVLILVIAAAILNSCRAEKQDLDSVYGGNHGTPNDLSSLVSNYDDFENINGQLQEPNYYKLQRRSAETSIDRMPSNLLEVFKRNLDQLGGPNLVRRSAQEFKDHDGPEKYADGQKEGKHPPSNRVLRELRDFRRRSNEWMTPYILARQLSEMQEQQQQQSQPMNPPKRSDGNFDEIDLSGLDTFNPGVKRRTYYGASGNYICTPVDY